MRSARRQGRELGRSDLPHLLRQGSVVSRPLSRMRQRPTAPGPPIRRRGTDLPGLRRNHPRLLLRPLRIEGELHGGRQCTRCTLARQLRELLDDGTGQIHPQLAPLVDAVLGMPEPLTGLKWLRSTVVRGLLADLAAGRVPITHDALQELPNQRAVAYLRDLLMSCGVLPTVDKQLLHAEALLHRKLTELADSPHFRMLRQFTLWHQLPRLRRRARRGPVVDAGRYYLGAVEEAARFLAWLDERGTQLGECAQADVDLWHAQALAHRRQLARPFLIWAKSTGRMPKHDIPTTTAGAGKPLTQTRRLALLRRALTDPRPPLRSRVAAALMLLYGQPVARLVRLTIDDIVNDDGQVLIRLGTPPLPVPEPLAGMLLELVDNRQNMTTVNPESQWLFPGRRAGQPVHLSTLLGHLRQDLGLPAQATKSATLRQLVLQAPAPVLADALGFSAKHMTRVWGEAGGSWTTYSTRETGHHSTT